MTHPHDPSNNDDHRPLDWYDPQPNPYRRWDRTPQETEQPASYSAAEQPTQSYPGAEQPTQSIPSEHRVPDGSVAAPEEHSHSHKVPTQRRQVGLTTALALMLVGAVAAGGITGVTLGSRSGTTGTTINALKEDPAKRSGAAEPGSVEDVAARVLPAVVSITTPTQEGSGSIISDDGLILTNNHVVAGSEDSPIVVTLHDGSHREADFIAGDGPTDVAVIKLRDARDLSVMTFGDSDELRVGQPVVAVGSPLGFSATVTSGIVSALNRPVRASGTKAGESSLIDAVQTDAAINPGNSGGPLVDMQGNLVGMNSVIATTSAGGSEVAGSIGVGFAIPSNQARRLANQLIETGKVTQPLIGVKVDTRSTPYGALVASVEPDSPAEKAGVKAGDIISKVNDRTIDSADALITAVRSHEFGDTITLTIVDDRGGNDRTVEVTLPNE